MLLMSEQHQWVIGIVFGPLVVAGLLGLWVVKTVHDKNGSYRPLFRQAPGPKWSFASWATNITAVGAGFGTVLASISLPKHPHPLDQHALVSLSLFFGLLVLAGPFIFQAIRNPTKSPVDQDADRWGFNITLLLACLLTFAAVVGEFTGLGLLYWEILGGGGWGKAAVGAASAAGVIALYYFAVTVPRLAEADWKAHQTLVHEHRARRVQESLAPAVREAVEAAGADRKPIVVVHTSTESEPVTWALP